MTDVYDIKLIFSIT